MPFSGSALRAHARRSLRSPQLDSVLGCSRDDVGQACVNVLLQEAEKKQSITITQCIGRVFVSTRNQSNQAEGAQM